MPSWNFSVIVYANQLCTKIDLAKLSFTVYGSKDRTGVYGAWNFSTECLTFCQVWISQTFDCTCVYLCKYIYGSFLAAFAYSVLGNVSVSALSLSWPVSPDTKLLQSHPHDILMMLPPACFTAGASVMSSVGFLPNTAFCAKMEKFNFGLIGSEKLLAHVAESTAWLWAKSKISSCCHPALWTVRLTWIRLNHSAIAKMPSTGAVQFSQVHSRNNFLQLNENILIDHSV